MNSKQMNLKNRNYKRGTVNVLVFTVVTLWASIAFADVYRCAQPDGKMAYQEIPCTSGSQKALDDTNAKARQLNTDARKKQEAEIKQASQAAQDEKKAIQIIAEDIKQDAEAEIKLGKGSPVNKKCGIAGVSLAHVFLANRRNMRELNIQPSEFMVEGCRRQIGELGANCVMECMTRFKNGAWLN